MVFQGYLADPMLVAPLFLPCLLFPLIIVLGIGGTIFWIFMLIECAKRISRGENNLIGWMIVIALLHWVGALIYYFCGRNPQQLGPPRF